MKKESKQFLDSLLKEEYRAELLIAHMRISMYSLALLDSLIDGFILQHSPAYQNSVYYRISGLLVCVLLSFGILLDVKAFETGFFKKYYGRYVKYFYIALDTLIIAVFLHLGLSEQRMAGLMDLPVSQILSIAFTVPATLIMIIGILRFNPRSSLFTLLTFIIAYISINEIRGYYPTWYDYFYQGDKINFATIFFSNTIFIMGCTTAFIAYRLRRLIVRSKRQENLERFLPEQVAQEIVEGKRGLDIQGKRSVVTILFSDIRGFTSISEKEEPEEVIDLLNSYLNDMIEIIFRYHGSIDKIMGDGIMAIYGAPSSSAEAPVNAVRSAIDMLRKLEDFNQIRKIHGKKPLKIGIGIHTGEVILGNVGTHRRMDFTAIGDTVNTASRLESMTKKLNYSVVLSGATRQSLNGEFKIDSLGEARIRGKADRLEIYGINAV